jgi:endonuclease/exonuclease/phosphatase family metal-dependent hydrolase
MRTKPALVAILVAVTVMALTSAAASAEPPTDSRVPMTVMTRNMDLGSDYGPALIATDAASFAHGVTTVYDEIVTSNIPERAAGIALEISQTLPSVVSLQEVSLVQRFTPPSSGFALIDQIDQLGALQGALADLGVHYAVASQANQLDITAPSDAGYYARVRDADVILVRADLPILSFSNPQGSHFHTLLPIPTPLGAIPNVNGWTSIDVSTRGSTVRVIDTHLESRSAAIAAAQATEILAGPANTTLPVVVAGDLNSGPGTTTDAYNVIAAAMTDTWSATRPHDIGFTHPLHGEDFFPYQTTPSSRIDLVFTRGLQPIIDMPIGRSDLTPSGLYPSDHAGVLARALAPSH